MDKKQIQTLSGIEITLPIEKRLYIDGNFVETEETFPTNSPSTGDRLADVSIATNEHVDEAVNAAARASEVWSAHPPLERRHHLDAFADELEAHGEALTKLDVADNGSSFERLRADMSTAADLVRYFSGLIPELKGETIPTGEGTIDFTKREPYGVVGAIIPFNHPAMFVAEKLAPALAAGNGIVIKPSEQTPLSALYIAHLVDVIDGFPDGLVNIVTGMGDVGATLVDHSDVGYLSMIGSKETGKAIMKSAADTLTPLMLELGGKNPTIVFPDADLDAAANGAVDAMALSWQGQSCGSGSRLLVHTDVADEILESVVEQFEWFARRTGDPFSEETEMGAIVSRSQYDRILEYIETAKAEGASLLTGGNAIDPDGDGLFIEPTVFAVEPDMTIANEEIFGPVLSVYEWETYDELIEVANGTEYGLTASVWTTDIDTAHTTIDDLEAGYIWVNQHGGHYLGAPFGGYKESGLRRKECLDELLDCTQVKNVNIRYTDTGLLSEDQQQSPDW